MAKNIKSCEKQRLDKWLFFTRVVRSRRAAVELIASGNIRVNHRKISKPSFFVKRNDVLTIAIQNRILVYRLLDFSATRSSAQAAITLYDNITPQPFCSSPPNELARADQTLFY